MDANKPRKPENSAVNFPAAASTWSDAEREAWTLLGSTKPLKPDNSFNDAVWARLGKRARRPQRQDRQRKILSMSFLAVVATTAAALLLIVRGAFIPSSPNLNPAQEIRLQPQTPSLTQERVRWQEFAKKKPQDNEKDLTSPAPKTEKASPLAPRKPPRTEPREEGVTLAVSKRDQAVIKNLDLLDNLDWLEKTKSIPSKQDLEWLSILTDLGEEGS